MNREEINIQANKIMSVSLWGINYDGTINCECPEVSFYNIRLAITSEPMQGNRQTLNDIVRVMEIVGANHYTFDGTTDSGVYSSRIELSYKMSEGEIKAYKIAKVEKELKALRDE